MTTTPTATTNVQGAFDAAAAQYDQQFNALPATRRIRGITWNVFLKHFAPGMRLLELNCGTGMDAIMLGLRKIHVHATDISAAMLEATNEKIAALNLGSFITTDQLSFHDLGRLRGQKYDGAYSNFGGLNCNADMPRLANDLHTLIKPGGKFIGTFLGGIAIWEMLAFLARGNIRQAFRRRTPEGSPANVAGSTVQTFYYSPGAVADVFSPHFTRVELLGLNIFTPPPTSQQAYRRFGKSIRLFERIDDTVMRHSPFNRIGDHFVIVLKHK
jgi:ubiquinone/menaquinone biosynthesis C-methylase UbiE